MEKVFHIVSHFDVGGAERVAVNIADDHEGIVEYHLVEVVRAHSSFTRVFINELRQKGIRYHRAFVPEVHFHYLFERIAALTFPLWFIFLFLRHRPTVIHSHTEVPDMAVRTFFALFPMFKARCRVVRTIHSSRLWTGMKSTGRWVERFFRNSHANVAISASVRDSYLKEYGQCPPIIYNGVAVSGRKSFDGLKAGRVNVLFAGRFEREKGVSHVVEIVRAMQHDDRYHFHIVGAGTLQPLVDEVSHCANVSVYPPLFGLSAYLSSFDYLLMPSEFEGLSMLSIEASMSGLPVIANDCPGLVDTLPAGWPLMVRDNDHGQYIHLFTHVIPAGSRQELSATAAAFANHEFGVKKMQEAYKSLYLHGSEARAVY